MGDSTAVEGMFAQAQKTSLVLQSGPVELAVLTQATLDRSPDLSATLAMWRKRHQREFLKLEKVTPQGTQNWLNMILRDEARILFIVSHNGSQIGHLGIGEFGRGGFEVCDVLRGESSGSGAMSTALQMLLDWTKDIGIPTIFLHVAADATKAIAFYHKLSFRPTALLPLVREESDAGVSWTISSEKETPWDRFLIRMEHS